MGYGVAGYTGYSRVSDNAHWMSDVMAGAALGYYTAHFVMLLPMDEGLMLTFSMAMK